MANNLTAVLAADTSKFVEEVRSAQHMLDKFVKESKAANRELGKSSPVTNEQITAYQRVISVLDKVASGTMNTKQQQAALADSVKELKIQWNSLSDAAKSSSFGKSLADSSKMAQEQLKALAAQVKIANDDVSKLGNAAPNGTLKKELRLTQTELEKLTQQYRLMSAAEKQSSSGRELASKMDDLRTKAGTLRDTIQDVNAEINIKASDTPNLDAFNAALGIGADALSLYSSVIAKVTGDEKTLKDAIATVMAVQSAANLLTKVTNALQSSSVIMLKTRAIQEAAAAAAIKVRAAAEAKGVIATNAATIAQKAFNTVAKANPYVLLATAVVAVGTAMYAFIKNTSEARQEQERLNKELETAKEKAESYRKTAADTYANLMTKYEELRAGWNKLKSDQEKNQFIKDNKSAIDDLTDSVNNATDAENYFNGNTSAVVDSFMKRAEAAARLGQLTDLYREQIELIDKKSGLTAKYTKELAQAGVQANKYELSQIKELRDVDAALEKNKQNIKKVGEEYGKLYETTRKSSVANKPKVKTSSKSNAKKENPISGSYDAIKEEQSKIEKLLRGKKLDPFDIIDKNSGQTVIERLHELEKKAEKEEIRLGLKVDPEIKNKEEAANKLKEEIEKVNKKFGDIELKPKNSSFDKANGVDNFNTKTVQGIQNVMNYNDGLLNQLNELKLKYEELGQTGTEKYNEIVDAIDKVKSEQSTLSTTISKDSMFNINNNISKLQSELEVTAYGTPEYNKIKAELDEWTKKKQTIEYNIKIDNKSALDKFKDIEGAFGSIDGVVGSFESMVDSIEEGASAWEMFMNVLNMVDSVLNAVTETIEAVNSIQKVLGETTKAATLISTEAATQESVNAGQEVAASMAKTTAKSGEAIAGATASGAKLPFPANLAAIAAGIAAVVAALAMIGSFANGGVVQGATNFGDYNIARVNNGEMILNGRQQKNLFNAIDENRLGGGGAVVGGEIKIKGSDLYVALKNYSKVKGTLGKNTGIL